MTNAVTLNPAMPNPTLSGTINAYGSVGVFTILDAGITFSKIFAAALFGPAGTNFSIVNTGVIESQPTGGNALDFGIVLANTGSVRNEGVISGAGGIALMGTAISGYVVNTGTITGTETGDDNDGVYAYGEAVVTNFNTGTITGEFAVYLGGGGYVLNFGGTLSGYAAGISGGPMHVTNAGLIEATELNGTGIDLFFGGTINNEAGGTIEGNTAVEFLRDATVTNAGLILGKGGMGGIGVAIGDYAGGTGIHEKLVNTGSIDGGLDGIQQFALYSNPTIINQAGGRITGGTGIDGARGLLNVTNHGYVGGTIGPAIAGYGYVKNTGTIAGAGEGLDLLRGTLINSGLITAGTTGLRGGVYAFSHIHLTNAAGGTISGIVEGIDLAQYGTIYNSGIVISNQTAVYLAGPDKSESTADSVLYNYGALRGGKSGILSNYGTVAIYNYATGRITGATGIRVNSAVIYNAGTISASGTGIIITHGGTIIESGRIIGAGGTAISFAKGHTNILDLIATATIQGAIDLNGTLNLEAGKTTGTLNAAQLQNVTAMTVAKSADWDLTNHLTAQALTNNGTLDDSGTLTINGKLSGSGTIILGAAPLTLNAAVAASQSLLFSGTAETLSLGDPAKFAGTIQNFAAADTIDLTGLTITNLETMNFAHGKLTLTATTGTYTITFANPAKFTGETFSTFADAHGTGITLTPAPAFLPTPTPTTPHFLPLTL